VKLIEGATRLVKPIFSGSVAGNSTVPSVRLNWPVSGRVLAVRGWAIDPTGTLTPDAASALMSVQILRDGDRSLFSNGESSDFAACRTFSPDACPWFILDVRVSNSQPWLVSWRNSSSSALLTELTFALREGED
tara:strand:+ start:1110 stop:1511 length:402 start_codon:yes stop_codon:yes gene_type:complete